MHQGRQIEAEQRLRPQRVDAPRAIGEDAAADDADVGERRQQQRIGPDQGADGHAGDRAAGVGAPPDQAAEEGRRKLRNGGKRQKPDRDELGIAGGAVVQVGDQQDGEDREPPHREQQRADVLAAREAFPAAAAPGA